MTADPVPDLSPRYKWYVVGMLWWISVFNYADRQALSAVLPLLETEFELTKVERGLVVAAFAWVYGLGAPFAGIVVDHVRRKTAILAGLYVWSLICVATASSRNFYHLLFFRGAEGLGETFYYPASNSLISDYHGPATRSRALGLHQTSVYFGTIAGSFFAGLIGQYYGWRWAFVIFGGLGILLGLVLHRFLREPRRGASELAAAGQLPWSAVIPMLLRTPTLLGLLLAFLGANFVATVLLGWMPSFLKERLSLSLAEAALTATLYVQLASMAAAPVGGWLADWLRRSTPGGRILVQAFGMFAGAPFVWWCGQAESVGVMIAALTCWGFAKGLYDANIFASAFDVVRPEARGTTAGFMNMVGWLGGGATGPVVIAYLAEHFGWETAMATAAGVYVAAGVILIGCLALIRRDVLTPTVLAGVGDVGR